MPTPPPGAIQVTPEEKEAIEQVFSSHFMYLTKIIISL